MIYRFRRDIAGGGYQTFEHPAKTQEAAQKSIARQMRVYPETLEFVCVVSRAELQDRAFRRQFGAEIDRLVDKDD